MMTLRSMMLLIAAVAVSESAAVPPTKTSAKPGLIIEDDIAMRTGIVIEDHLLKKRSSEDHLFSKSKPASIDTTPPTVNPARTGIIIEDHLLKKRSPHEVQGSSAQDVFEDNIIMNSELTTRQPVTDRKPLNEVEVHLRKKRSETQSALNVFEDHVIMKSKQTTHKPVTDRKPLNAVEVYLLKKRSKRHSASNVFEDHFIMNAKPTTNKPSKDEHKAGVIIEDHLIKKRYAHEQPISDVYEDHVFLKSKPASIDTTPPTVKTAGTGIVIDDHLLKKRSPHGVDEVAKVDVVEDNIMMNSELTTRQPVTRKPFIMNAMPTTNKPPKVEHKAGVIIEDHLIKKRYAHEQPISDVFEDHVFLKSKLAAIDTTPPTVESAGTGIVIDDHLLKKRSIQETGVFEDHVFLKLNPNEAGVTTTTRKPEHHIDNTVDIDQAQGIIIDDHLIKRRSAGDFVTEDHVILKANPKESEVFEDHVFLKSNSASIANIPL